VIDIFVKFSDPHPDCNEVGKSIRSPLAPFNKECGYPYNVLPPQFEKLVYNKPTATSSIYPTVIGIMFTINLAHEISFKSALNPI
jgi:hypothetical protein